ncbi:uncharacterized protein LOC119630040 isoform X1 [Bombyx mori]|uniref:Integrase catalytic domain-containing protein n=1 Tax=Bombyx mori TaxID=7091 RepID=A0A8R2R5B9_BOMMO|nr:uncharacterized protein LOC119630040 isoform X1 [Bombyx mori]
MSQHSEDLDTLIKRRGAIKAKLTIFRNYIKPLTSFSSLTDLQRFELEGRYERIQCLYNDFDKLQTEIETLLDAPDDDFKSRCEFEDQYHPAVALARSLLSATTNSEGSAMVRVGGADGTKHPARVLLDNVKAVHIELVTALSSEAYIAALKRFVSRRGKPRSIWSDNGTNFVGACNELKGVLSNSDIASFMSQEGIDFNFSPPYSPHFNGLAEAAVKATKGHLKKLLSLTHLTYEEMSSCLCQIEAILNSRPLTPISSDPLDLTALTPAHFLIGRPLTSVPHPQITDGNITRLERYQRVELIRQHFWKRFINEYISLLQQKSKWSTSTGSLIPGTLVLVKDRTLPALLWPLGRITMTYPGSDGITRVAEVKMRTGTVVRGFNSICPLPLH